MERERDRETEREIERDKKTDKRGTENEKDCYLTILPLLYPVVVDSTVIP